MEFNISVMPGEVEFKWVKCGECGMGPDSPLIQKFKNAYLSNTTGKNIDTSGMISMQFHKRDGTDWGDKSITVKCKEIHINNRWAVINRAIQLLHGVNNAALIDNSDIANVTITVPELTITVPEL